MSRRFKTFVHSVVKPFREIPLKPIEPIKNKKYI